MQSGFNALTQCCVQVIDGSLLCFKVNHRSNAYSTFALKFSQSLTINCILDKSVEITSPCVRIVSHFLLSSIKQSYMVQHQRVEFHVKVVGSMAIRNRATTMQQTYTSKKGKDICSPPHALFLPLFISSSIKRKKERKDMD